MSYELLTWIAEQRAVCAVQKQRWEGVAPERLEEACARIEQLIEQTKRLEAARLEAEAQIDVLRAQLRRPAPASAELPPGVASFGPVVPQHAPRPSFVVPIRLDRWQLGVWSYNGLPVQLGGEIPTPSPAMVSAYEGALKKLQGSVVELPVW